MQDLKSIFHIFQGKITKMFYYFIIQHSDHLGDKKCLWIFLLVVWYNLTYNLPLHIAITTEPIIFNVLNEGKHFRFIALVVLVGWRFKDSWGRLLLNNLITKVFLEQPRFHWVWYISQTWFTCTGTKSHYTTLQYRFYKQCFFDLGEKRCFTPAQL